MYIINIPEHTQPYLVGFSNKEAFVDHVNRTWPKYGQCKDLNEAEGVYCYENPDSDFFFVTSLEELHEALQYTGRKEHEVRQLLIGINPESLSPR